MDRLSINLSLIRIRHSLRCRRNQYPGQENRIDSAAGYEKIGTGERFDYDEEPAGWITLENDQHVPLNSSGIAIGGAGGWAKGKDFSGAKVKKSGKAAKSPSAPEKKEKPEVPAEVSPQKEEKPETPGVKDTQKATLRKKAEAASKKCRTLFAKRQKMYDKIYNWIGDSNNAKYYKEAAQKALEDEESRLRDAQEEADRYTSGKTVEELKKEAEDHVQEVNSLFSKKNACKEGSSEYDKFSKQYDDAQKRLNDTLYELNAKEELAKAQKDYEEARKKADERNREFEKIESEKIDPDVYNKLCDDYEEAAKKRDEAILAAFETPKDCETSDEVNDYLKAKGYYRHDGEDYSESDNRVDITKMLPEHAIAYAGRIDGIMQDYPWMKGKLNGIDCHDFMNDEKTTGNDYSKAYGYANGTHLSLAQGFYGDKTKVPKKYRHNVFESFAMDIMTGHHPKGLDYTMVIDHEFTHVMENIVQQEAEAKGIKLLDGRVANTVMQRVQEKLYGEYSPEKENEVRKKVSGYAASNEGIDPVFGENTSYGRNTEFLAEAMAEARGSEKPSEVSKVTREVFEELIKEVGLQ